jgi:hypothetical protein
VDRCRSILKRKLMGSSHDLPGDVILASCHGVDPSLSTSSY